MNFWYAALRPVPRRGARPPGAQRRVRRQRRQLPRRQRATTRPTPRSRFARKLRHHLPVDHGRRTTAPCSSPSPGTVPPNAVPTTLVLDKEGRVAARILGQVQDASILDTLIRDAIAEEPSVNPSARSSSAASCSSPCPSPCSPGWCRSPRRACCRSFPATSATSAASTVDDGEPGGPPAAAARRRAVRARLQRRLRAHRRARRHRRACCSMQWQDLITRIARRRRHPHGPRLHRPVHASCSAPSSRSGSPRPASPAPRCSASCSASAGRPASARPSSPSRRSASTAGSAGRGALLGARLLPRPRHPVPARRARVRAGSPARSHG